MRDLNRELNEWDGTWPSCWRPREGETLVGTIRRYSVGQSAYGPVRTVIVEKDGGGCVSVWLSSVVLAGVFQQEKPKVGERIGLRYLGKHPEKGYKRYHLVVDREEAPLDWEPLGGEQGVPADPDEWEDEGDPFGSIPAMAGARR